MFVLCGIAYSYNVGTHLLLGFVSQPNLPGYLAEMRKYEVIFGQALNIGGLIDCYGVEIIKVIIKSRKIVNLILDHGRVDE